MKIPQSMRVCLIILKEEVYKTQLVWSELVSSKIYSIK